MEPREIPTAAPAARTLARSHWLFLVLINGMALAAMWGIHRAATKSMMEEVQGKARELAAFAALGLDADPLVNFVDGSAAETMAFRQTFDYLRRYVSKSDDVKFIYVLRPDFGRGANQWRFVIDSEPFAGAPATLRGTPGVTAGAAPGDPYDGTDSPRMVDGLRAAAADDHFTTDDWGTFISGYYPLRRSDTSEVFAVLGVDITEAQFLGKLKDIDRAALLATLVLLGLLNTCAYALWTRSLALEDSRRLEAELALRNRELNTTNGELGVTLGSLRERERAMSGELELAQKVQERFLPHTFPFPGSLRFAASYKACSTIGGDLYDAIALDEETALFFIADVSGHGVSAALVTAVLKVSVERCRDELCEALRGLTGAERDRAIAVHAASFLRHLNLHLRASMHESGFVTLLLGVLRVDSGQLVLANAGHNPPLLCETDTGRVAEIDVPSNLPLGLLTQLDFRVTTLVMPQGSKLLCYTDGLTELMNARGEEFGIERLVESCVASCPRPASGMLDAIGEAAARHAGDNPPHDDVALLVIEFLGSPVRSEVAHGTDARSTIKTPPP